MSDQATCEATRSATSSLASEAGRSPCARQAGEMTDLFGPVPVLANLSARQAKDLGLLTSGTFGRTSTGSSKSAALQSSLESRLRARTASSGSTLYALTWKDRATPSGRRICALRASARRTFDSDSTGWPTAAARDWKGATKDRWGTNARPLNEVAVLAGWPTMLTADARIPGHSSTREGSQGLSVTVALAGWPTPMAGTPAQNGNNAAGNNDSSRKTVALCGWPTPNSTVVDAKPRPPVLGNRKPSDPQISTADIAVHLCGWPTPTAKLGDERRGSPSPDVAMRRLQEGRRNLDDMAAITGPARLLATGEMLTGSTAEMSAGGQLNPAHSRWLMGYPPEWDSCGATAMPSSRKSPQRSSKPAA